MQLVLVILCSWISTIDSFLCDSQESLYCDKLITTNTDCDTSILNVSPSFCTLDTNSKSNDLTKRFFGDVFLSFFIGNSTSNLISTISLLDKYQEVYIKLSENVDENCNQFTFKEINAFTINTLIFNCLWNSTKQLQRTDFIMDVTVLKDMLYVPKKLLFSLHDTFLYGDHIALDKRLIFSYIDFTDINKIILKVQQLANVYNVTHYKIEVFKEKDKKVQILDIRLIPYNPKSKYIDFEYITFNEEGYYYFTISVVGAQCPEDVCKKTVTGKLYISRKGTHLIIGIVGASFFIPLVLYIFYIWSCKYKYEAELSEFSEKVLILYDPYFTQHDEVVVALANTIKHLTGIDVIVDPINITKNTKGNVLKQCSDNLILSSYILYLTPPVTGNLEDCILDGMTYNFLKKETQRHNSEKKIVVVYFPYTNSEPPRFLSGCSKFQLMKDFTSFMNIFEESLENHNYDNDLIYKDLCEKIKKALSEAENLSKNLPNIVIEHSEPREVDVLL